MSGPGHPVESGPQGRGPSQDFKTQNLLLIGFDRSKIGCAVSTSLMSRVLPCPGVLSADSCSDDVTVREPLTCFAGREDAAVFILIFDRTTLHVCQHFRFVITLQ